MTSYSAQIQGPAYNRISIGSFNPLAVFTSAWRHRALLYRLARREVEARYRGAMLGILWSLLIPLFMLGVYTLVFSGIFHSTWDIPPGGKGNYFLVLFMGLILNNFFGDCIGRAPGIMLGNVSYIKRIVFPLEILSTVAILSAAFDLVISIAVLMAIYVATLGTPLLMALLLPIVVFPFLLMTLGMVWFLSSLGVYLRDLRQIIGVVLAALPFLSTVFYPMSVFARFPQACKTALYFNPLTIPVVQARQVVFFNQIPSWKLWLAYAVCSYIFASAGLAWFKYSQKGFADVV